MLTRSALLRSVAALALALSATASAREWTSEKYNCAVTIPDGKGWGPVKEDPDPEMVLEVEKDDGALSFGLEVKITTVTNLTADVKAILKEDVPGDNIVTAYSKDTTVAGWPAFEVGEKMVMNGTEITTTGYYMFAGGYQYSLVITKVGGKAQEDAELRALASSFRFLTTPPQPEEGPTGMGATGIAGVDS